MLSKILNDKKKIKKKKKKKMRMQIKQYVFKNT